MSAINKAYLNMQADVIGNSEQCVQAVVPETITRYDFSILPWPTIIIAVLGASLTIYTAVAPNIDNSRRGFGAILIILWTLLWALLLWILWRNNNRAAAWWLLLIPSISIILFFVFIVVMDLEA